MYAVSAMPAATTVAVRQAARGDHEPERQRDSGCPTERRSGHLPEEFTVSECKDPRRQDEVERATGRAQRDIATLERNPSVFTEASAGLGHHLRHDVVADVLARRGTLRERNRHTERAMRAQWNLCGHDRQAEQAVSVAYIAAKESKEVPTTAADVCDGGATQLPRPRHLQQHLWERASG